MTFFTGKQPSWGELLSQPSSQAAALQEILTPGYRAGLETALMQAAYL